MRKVGIGIVGVGAISAQYLKNFRTRYEYLEPVAVFDVIIERAKQAAEEYGIPGAYDKMEDLLNDEKVEIVLNLTPPQLHKQINMAVLSAGKHLYCEKPFATSVEDCLEMIALAEEKGLKIACAPDTFLGSAWQSVRKAIEEGCIGDVINVNAFWGSMGPEAWHPAPAGIYKFGAGPMLDMGVYTIQQLISLFGSADSLACIAKRTFDKRVINSMPDKGKEFDVSVNTNYAALLKMKNSVTANIGVSFETTFSHQPYMEIHGTEGSIFVDTSCHQYNGKAYVLKKEAVLEDIKDLPPFEAADRYISAEMAEKNQQVLPCPYEATEDPNENMRGLGLNDLAWAVVEGREPRAAAGMAVHCLEIMLGMEKSAAEGSFVKLETTCERPVTMAPEELVR